MTWSDTRDLAFHAGVVCTGLWAVRCVGGVVIGETFPRHKYHWTLQAAATPVLLWRADVVMLRSPCCCPWTPVALTWPLCHVTGQLPPSTVLTWPLLAQSSWIGLAPPLLNHVVYIEVCLSESIFILRSACQSLSVCQSLSLYWGLPVRAPLVQLAVCVQLAVGGSVALAVASPCCGCG